MRRLAQSALLWSARLRLSCVLDTARHQTTSLSQQHGVVDEDVSTAFPGQETAAEEDSGAHNSQQQRRYPHRHHRKSEADGLLRDIFALEKQVAAEQQRQRLSVRASQLDQAPVSSLKAPRKEARPTTTPTYETDGASGETARAASAPPPPVLSMPTPEETATAASRAQLLRGDAPVFATVPASSSPSFSTPSPPPPALQSWTPPFAFTSEHLRASLEGPASEVAFTLEELEDTLFSPAADVNDEGGNDEVGSASPPAPSPSFPQRSTTVSSPPMPTPPQTVTLAVGETASCSGATSEHRNAGKVEEVATKADDMDQPTTTAPASSAGSSSSHAEVRSSIEMLANPSQSRASQEPKSEDVASTLPPVLKCRVRGTAVVVTESRLPLHLCELVEALHEAVTFTESLPAAPSGVAREVRLRADVSAMAQASHPFIGSGDMGEAFTSVEEGVRVQLRKERLLRRIQDGPARGLHYIAEVQVPTTTATPIELRNFAAELLLACADYTVSHVARPNTRLDGDGTNVIQLSFSGIGIGVFPAAATICTVARLTERLLANEDQRARLMSHLGDTGVHQQSARYIADLTGSTMLRLHLFPAELSSTLLAVRRSAKELSCKNARVTLTEEATRLWETLSTFLAQQWGSIQQRTRFARQAQVPKEAPDASLAVCVTTAQAWMWLCRAVLSESSSAALVVEPIINVMRCAPLQRCRRSYALAGASVSQPSELLSSATVLSAATAPSPRVPYVMEVSSSTLARTSVADLASEIRDQPSDVVLAIAADVPLEQRLKFLASLHLTDTGSHHQVTVLLAGEPREVDECASLTRSSARLIAPRATDDGPTALQPSDPSWLHQIVEVSVARSAASDASRGGSTSAEVTAAVHYVAKHWHRPCIVTAKSEVGQALLRAARAADTLLQRSVRGAQTRSPQGRAAGQRDSLAPLVVRGHNALTSALPRDASAVIKPGLAFLMVLDVACHALCREVGVISPAHVNALSIAALQLDASSGGVFDAADRMGGDTVESIVSAMEEAEAEAAAAKQSLSFSCLPLLRWMVEEKLLFYQLNPMTLARFTMVHSRD